MSSGSIAPAELLERREAWRALVARTLGGDASDTALQTRTYDGLTLDALYGPAPGADPSQSGLGEALRARGRFDPDRAWDVRAPVSLAAGASANAWVLEELSGGASSILIEAGGADPSGARGGSPAAAPPDAGLAAALEGVYLDLAPIELSAGLDGPEAARSLVRHAEARTLRPRLSLGLDPVSALAVWGDEDRERHFKEAAQAALELSCERAFLASGRFVHEAGGCDADEIAAALASGLLYLKLLDAGGMDLTTALGRIELGLSTDGNYFVGVAKLRAVRRVWRRLGEELVAEPPPARLNVRTSRRMLSVLDPWVNMLRLTAAAFGAAAGGADVLVVDPFTDPLGAPSPLARRQARNVQLILMEEAGLGAVEDPAGGAYFIEHLTSALAEEAWRRFQDLEREGGIGDARAMARLARSVDEVRGRRLDDLRTRRRGLVGVSEFAALRENPPEAGPRPDTRAPEGPFRPMRDSEEFEALRTRSGALSPEVAVMPLGSPREYADRLRFLENLLAAGGVAVRRAATPPCPAGPGGVVVLCGSRAAYAEEAPGAISRALADGARHIYLTGPPSEFEDERLSGHLHRGSDLVGVLSVLLDQIGATET